MIHSVIAKQSNKVTYVQEGFTLVETMIVVVIIAILAAVAIPSYKQHVEKGKRNEVKSELERLALIIEKQKIAYKRYDRIPLSLLGFDNTGKKFFPDANQKNYEITITKTQSNNVSNTWNLIATADYNSSNSIMKGNGDITLNYKTERCWEKGKFGNDKCKPNATSGWKD